jgi:hypothetical protein
MATPGSIRVAILLSHIFLLCICTVHFCCITVHLLRVTTYIFLEETVILQTIKGLLWQTTPRQSSSKPPKNFDPMTLSSQSCGVSFLSGLPGYSKHKRDAAKHCRAKTIKLRTYNPNTGFKDLTQRRKGIEKARKEKHLKKRG